MIVIPERDNRIRWAIISCSLLIWLWLNPEDDHVWPVALLGTLCAGVAITYWGLGRFGGKQFTIRGLLLLSALSGALLGLSASIITALLMLLKNARHAHFFPDFPTGQILAMLELAPLWILVGSLFGFGLGLTIISMHKIDIPTQ